METLTEWVTLGDTGTVTGFTVVRYEEPYQPVKPPYILALIQLDGAAYPLAHIVKGVAPNEMRVGLRVKAVFAETSTSTILELGHFQPTEDAQTTAAAALAMPPGQT